jgi:hypothetical protein
MPRLGAAVEPARFERVEPWWRGVAAAERALAAEAVPAPTAQPEPLAGPLPDPID